MKSQQFEDLLEYARKALPDWEEATFIGDHEVIVRFKGPHETVEITWKVK